MRTIFETRREDRWASVTVEQGRVATGGEGTEPGETRLVDGYIVPGLRDAHFHPITYAASLVVPSLKSASDFAEVGRRLVQAGDRTAPKLPLSAIRLDDETLAEGRLPTRYDLDAMVGDRPLIVHRYCGHIAMANSAALRLAGVTALLPTRSEARSIATSTGSQPGSCGKWASKRFHCRWPTRPVPPSPTIRSSRR